jgi:hypothetical protein
MNPEESNLILLGSRTATLAPLLSRKKTVFIGLLLWHTHCGESQRMGHVL